MRRIESPSQQWSGSTRRRHVSACVHFHSDSNYHPDSHPQSQLLRAVTIRTSPCRFGVGVGVGVGVSVGVGVGVGVDLNLDLGLRLGVGVSLVSLKAEVCESMPAAEWIHVTEEEAREKESALEAED